MQKEHQSCCVMDVSKLDRYSDDQGRTATCMPRLRVLEIRLVNRKQATELGAPCESEMQRMFGDADEFLAFHFESPAAPTVEKHENQKKGHEEDSVDVVSMSSHDVNLLLGAASNQDEQCTLILAWKPKLSSKKIMISESGSGGRLVMEAFKSETEGITTQKQLHQYQAYSQSSKQTQKAWQEKIAASKRSGRQTLWAVTFTQMRILDAPVTITGQNIRHRKEVTVNRSQLKTLTSEATVPQMRLQDTAKYFLDQLSQQDLDKIKQVSLMLDNVVLRVGTTCSGWSLATVDSLGLFMQGQRDRICLVLYL